MRVLYITDQIYLHGGAEKILIQKLNYWVESFGYEVKLITSHQKDKKPFFPLNEKVQLIDLDIDYAEGISFFSPKNFSKFPKHYSKLKHEIKQYRPDAVFVISQTLARLIVPMAVHKSPCYYEYHTSFYGFQLGNEKLVGIQKVKNFIVNQIIAFSERFYTKIVFLNQAEYDHFQLKNAVIIPNFYDRIANPSTVQKKKSIISLGRLSFQKGYDLLIDTWELVDKKVTNWELNIYGNGDDFEKLTKKINSKTFKNPLHLHHAIDHVNEKLAESSFYVMSSRFETFPMVLLEAMSNELPIVAFDCPTGPRSMVIEGEDGVLAKPTDIHDLAEKMIYLMQNPDITKRMGAKALVNIKRFNPEIVMQQWNDLLLKNVKK